MMNKHSGALKGVRVLDFGRYISGPFSGMLLADMGADVIRVEKIGGDVDRHYRPFTKDGKSLYTSVFNRNKRCITLNFRSEEGRDILKQLVKNCDVLLNNYRPGVMDSMGIGYEEARAINPKIIYASISGFGQEGKYSKRPAFDGIAMATAGVMSCNWTERGPQGLGTAIADITTGYVNTLAIMMALFHRERTGEGQFIDTAMVDAVTPFLETLIPTYYLTGVISETRERHGGDPTSAPANTFKAKDGYICMHAGTDANYQKLLELVEIPSLKKLMSAPEFMEHQSRKNAADKVEALVNEWVSEKTVDEVEQLVSSAGIPCAIVNTIDRVIASDLQKERKNIVWIDMPGIGKIPYPGNPLKLSVTPAIEFMPGQDVGQSNSEVYQEVLGFSEEKMEDLKERGVI